MTNKQTLTMTVSALGLLFSAFTQDVNAMDPYPDSPWDDFHTTMAASRAPDEPLSVADYQANKAEIYESSLSIFGEFSIILPVLEEGIAAGFDKDEMYSLAPGLSNRVEDFKKMSGFDEMDEVKAIFSKAVNSQEDIDLEKRNGFYLADAIKALEAISEQLSHLRDDAYRLQADAVLRRLGYSEVFSQYILNWGPYYGDLARMYGCVAPQKALMAVPAIEWVFAKDYSPGMSLTENPLETGLRDKISESELPSRMEAFAKIKPILTCLGLDDESMIAKGDFFARLLQSNAPAEIVARSKYIELRRDVFFGEGDVTSVRELLESHKDPVRSFNYFLTPLEYFSRLLFVASNENLENILDTMRTERPDISLADRIEIAMMVINDELWESVSEGEYEELFNPSEA